MSETRWQLPMYCMPASKKAVNYNLNFRCTYAVSSRPICPPIGRENSAGSSSDMSTILPNRPRGQTADSRNLALISLDDPVPVVQCSSDPFLLLTACAISSETCTRCLSAEERRKLTAVAVAAVIWEERLQCQVATLLRVAHSVLHTFLSGLPLH